MRVLLADDNPSMLRALRLTLAHKGLEVSAASSLAAALAAARQERPDALVTDLDLGGESGWDLIRQLRAEGLGSTFVVLTGSVRFDVPGDLEPVRVVQKPADLSELLEALGASPAGAA